MQFEGERRTLPITVDLATYRIVQVTLEGATRQLRELSDLASAPVGETKSGDESRRTVA
jgi:hypothetical protein